jgi:uncharacterized protein (TIGR03067 family)
MLLALTQFSIVATAPPLAPGEDKDEAVKQERKKYEGIWRVIFLQADGKQAADKDAKKIVVVNKTDGSWSIQAEGKEVAKGTSEIDPTKSPKTIDFTPALGFDPGKVHLGIYDIKENCRKLCFAPAGKDRPTEFSSKPGTGHLLVIFQREKP